MALCENCKRLIAPRPRIVVRRRSHDWPTEVYHPLDVLAVHCVSKHSVLYLRGGKTTKSSNVTLQSLLENNPDVFYQVRRNWLVNVEEVTAERVIAERSDGRGLHHLKLNGVPMPIPVARRVWRDFATHMGWYVPPGPKNPRNLHFSFRKAKA